MQFTDNNTGKQYSINGNTVTQARNGVVLSVAEMEDVAGWMDMMGFKTQKVAQGVRLVKNKSFEYGKQNYSVEARTEAQADALVVILNSMGWKDEYTNCMEDTGYDGEGVSVEYCIRPHQEADFRKAFKVAKAKM